jgi:hypothetical protein
MRQEDPVIHSFLLIGQSNMAGRGIIGEVPAIDHRGLMFMLRNGRWQPMQSRSTRIARFSSPGIRYSQRHIVGSQLCRSVCQPYHERSV